MDYKEKIEALLKDKEKFGETVYTPLEQAIPELQKRWEDKALEKALDPFFKHGVPEPLKKSPRAVIFRQLATPNYEVRRFLTVPDATGIQPLLWEYLDDKFTSNNPLKYFLGKMGFHEGVGKKGGHKVAYENVIDFNHSNGKKIKDVNTLWGQSLVDFHHELLEKSFPGMQPHLFDASHWFSLHGGNAKEYYRSYVALFVRNGILFENFVLEGHELEFTRDIFLPVFFEIWEKTGKKPLIVALEPTDIENDEFWMWHPNYSKEHILAKKGEKVALDSVPSSAILK